MTSLKTITDEGKREFEEKFKCINSDCDGKGNIPRQINEGEWEAEQCQFCFEYRFSAMAFLDTYAEKVATATMEAIFPKEREHTENESDPAWHRKDALNDCCTSIEQAFQTFLGKV